MMPDNFEFDNKEQEMREFEALPTGKKILALFLSVLNGFGSVVVQVLTHMVHSAFVIAIVTIAVHPLISPVLMAYGLPRVTFGDVWAVLFAAHMAYKTTVG